MTEIMIALSAAHFQLQYLYGFCRLKAGLEKVLRGSGRGGGEYTVLEVKGYPGDVVQNKGDVPPGLKRKCLQGKKKTNIQCTEQHFLRCCNGVSLNPPCC